MQEGFEVVQMTVNGVEHSRLVRTSTTLLEFIREELKLKGTKKSCDNGGCGACTVIMDGKTVYSCHLLAVQADGASITTIEGVSAGAELHPVQQALIDAGAVQCGFCTPGIVLAAKNLLEECPDPDDSQIKYAMAGNLCRCTGYVKIEQAVKNAARQLRGESL